MHTIDRKTVKAIKKDLELNHSLYEVEVLAIQRVKCGYIAIFNVSPKPGMGDRLPEYERLAFYNEKLNRRNDIILQ